MRRMSSPTFAIRENAATSGFGQLRAAEHRGRDHLVRVANEHRPHLARPLHGGAQALGEVHLGDLLRQAFPCGLVERHVRLGNGGIGIHQRVVSALRPRRDRHDAAIGEVLPRRIGRIRPGQRGRQHLFGNAVQRGIRGGPHLGICVVEQENEQGQLLLRTGRQTALRGQEPRVAIRLAPLEEIEQRCRHAHAAMLGTVSGRVKPGAEGAHRLVERHRQASAWRTRLRSVGAGARLAHEEADPRDTRRAASSHVRHAVDQ